MPIAFQHQYQPLPTCWREEYIVTKCRDRRVLDLGFMDAELTEEKVRDGSHLHMILRKFSTSLAGIDIDRSRRDLLPPDDENYQLHFGDVEDPATYAPLAGREFDVIVVGEILEHLNNPGLFLQAVRQVMSDQTHLIVTVPNAFRYHNLGFAMKGIEMVHPDHNFWYSPTTIQTLLNRNGYDIEELLAYTLGADERPELMGPANLMAIGLVVASTLTPPGQSPRRWHGVTSSMPK